MASTFEKIVSGTTDGTLGYLNLTSIPGTYDDLLLRTSLATNINDGGWALNIITFNGNAVTSWGICTEEHLLPL